jgi:hypothetical protein
LLTGFIALGSLAMIGALGQGLLGGINAIAIAIGSAGAGS